MSYEALLIAILLLHELSSMTMGLGCGAFEKKKAKSILFSKEET